jgi:UDP-glucose:(glucosyl)LPS alpha-1,2-glucosyltransferase
MSEPKGGTELQHDFLNARVDSDLLSHFQICTSIPNKVPIDENKINILWQKNSYDQPNIKPFFADKANHHLYDWYVFNSHWNYEKFRMLYDIPTEKCHVIKNGVTHFPERKPYKQGDTLRLVFQPTPWRGLNVLLLAMQHLENENIILDVYSSCEIYGEEFAKSNNADWERLFDQARMLPNVNYIGYQSNDFILNKMKDYHMFAYPCIWEETSCISALEAMAAGLYCVTTNYGALYETCAEFPIYVNYTDNYKKLAKNFAYAIQSGMEHLHKDYLHEHLLVQQDYTKRFYSWDKKAIEWTKFLEGALHARSK